MVENDEKNNIVQVEVNKLKRVDKEKNRCSSCGRKRVIKNKELNLCSICDMAKRYWSKDNYEAKTEDKINILPNENINRDTDIKTEIEDKEDKEDITVYLCENCDRKVKYAQKKCICGTILNWLNTDLENDDNYLICGSCGAILDKNSTSCFNCGGG